MGLVRDQSVHPMVCLAVLMALGGPLVWAPWTNFGGLALLALLLLAAEAPEVLVRHLACVELPYPIVLALRPCS